MENKTHRDSYAERENKKSATERKKTHGDSETTHRDSYAEREKNTDQQGHSQLGQGKMQQKSTREEA